MSIWLLLWLYPRFFLGLVLRLLVLALVSRLSIPQFNAFKVHISFSLYFGDKTKGFRAFGDQGEHFRGPIIGDAHVAEDILGDIVLGDRITIVMGEEFSYHSRL